MSGDSITLALDGDPTLDDLAVALDALRDLLAGLTQAVSDGEHIDWRVDGLATGSALATFQGQAADPVAVQSVTTAYLEVARTLSGGRPPAFPEWPQIDTVARRLTKIIDGRVPAIRFETADDDVIVSSSVGPEPVDRQDVPSAYGAVLGRVQTLSSRGSLRFTLYDQVHNKAVSCYVPEGHEHLMRDAWDRIALVRGWVRRDMRTGRPLSVRRVRSVEVRDYEGSPGEWRGARGAQRQFIGEDTAEAMIQRLRSAR